MILPSRVAGVRWGLLTERLFWWTLIGAGIVGTLIFVAFFAIVVWGLVWGVPGQNAGR
jgi:hypothetical protein